MERKPCHPNPHIRARAPGPNVASTASQPQSTEQAFHADMNNPALQLLTYYINAANAANSRCDYADAFKWSQQALALDNAVPEAWYNLGIAEHGRGNQREALQAFLKAQAGSRRSTDAQNSIGLKLLELGAYSEAEQCLKLSISLSPEYAIAHSNLGKLRLQQGRLDEAEACFRTAIRLQPAVAVFYSNLAGTLHEMFRGKEAEELGRQAIELDPRLPQAWCTLGSALASLARDVEAVACFDQALKLDPAYWDAHWNQCLAYLRLRRYEEGWEKFDTRWQIDEFDLKPLATRKLLWRGQPSNQPLLIWGEQGIGDQILYAGILPELQALPQKKYVALDKRLIPLFQRSMPGFEFVDLRQVNDAMDFAEQLPMGALPRYFRPTKESFAAARHPYLMADPERTANLRQKLFRVGKRVVGVSWSSSRKNIGHHKSIALEQMLAPLATNQLHFVNLQYGDTVAERLALQDKHGISVQNIDEVDNFNDIDGLAALIQACDIVITTSNSTAHLAGALGKETLLLLPLGKGKFWYWVEHEGHTPWYPSIRMFAQAQAGQWQEPLEKIRAHIENMQWN